jgi:tetratricopeptide (TPR) repeat protein
MPKRKSLWSRVKTISYTNKGENSALYAEMLMRRSFYPAASRHYREAAESFSKILQLAPDDIRAQRNLGSALVGLGESQAQQSLDEEAARKFREAIKVYETTLQLAPDDIGARTSQGLAFFRLGQIQTR